MSAAVQTMPQIILSAEEQRILATFHDSGTYETAAAHLGVSRGKVWRVVMKAGARKHEGRIRARADARKLEQTRSDVLREIIGTSTTADVLDFARSLPTASVALHATSVPFNVSRPYGGYSSSDRDSFLAYRGNLMILTSEIARTLKPGGVAFLQVGMTKDDTGHRTPIDKWLYHMCCDASLTFQSEIYWPASHGLTPTMRVAERMEMALVFSKGDVRTFNPTPAREPTKQPGKRAFHGPNKGNISSHPSGSFPTNVWRIPHLGHNHPELTEHPAQFPVALAARAILLWTMPTEDLVCDLFVGSGSTHEACIRTGRPFVGCDLFYESLREKRLASVVPDLVCPLPGVTDESLAVWQAEARRRDLPANPISEQLEAQMLFDLSMGDAA